MGNKIGSSGDSDREIYTARWVVSNHTHTTKNKDKQSNKHTHIKGVQNLLDRKVLLSQ